MARTVLDAAYLLAAIAGKSPYDNYTAAIPLNDANTVYAPHYNLLQAKIGWQHKFNHKNRLEIYAGSDNLLNEKYSLGDDLNATGSRYYNAAPLRNYYAGFSVMF